ncbi:hypothetical protein ACOMHN_038206 [Nucella lapillus]
MNHVDKISKESSFSVKPAVSCVNTESSPKNTAITSRSCHDHTSSELDARGLCFVHMHSAKKARECWSSGSGCAAERRLAQCVRRVGDEMFLRRQPLHCLLVLSLCQLIPGSWGRRILTRWLLPHGGVARGTKKGLNGLEEDGDERAIR